MAFADLQSATTKYDFASYISAQPIPTQNIQFAFNFSRFTK